MGYIQLRTPKDIGLLLRDARKRAKLGQAELAARLGVSRKWVIDVERGNAGASLGRVLRALALVGVKIGAIQSEDHVARAKSPAAPPVDIDIDGVVASARKAR